MTSRVSLLAIIVALCLGHLLCRRLEQKIFSANLEVYDPWEECVGRANENATSCGVILFETEDVQLENIGDIRYTLFIEIGSDKQKFKVT